ALAQEAQVELLGEIAGATADALASLQSAALSFHRVRVSCEWLVRLDEAAARAVLEWARASHARGCAIEFVGVPRLVDVLLRMLGVEPFAKLSVRTR
ncbi:MAG: STAS domain-containing protein, partial [Rhodoferax sp.]